MIKIDLQHNLSSLRIPELRVDPKTTILALKENIQKRYGSQPFFVRLTLKNKKGQKITQMNQDLRSLEFYGVQNGMLVHITDLNPNSIHKQIENINQVEKYTISEQSYQKLSTNFRKWKQSFLTENPQVIEAANGQPEICDPDYLKTLAETMALGQRCQLENGARGEIRYIGKVNQIGFGYFIGIQLDQKVQGMGNGVIGGMYYFHCQDYKAIFLRPNKLEVGVFPKIQQNDQI